MKWADARGFEDRYEVSDQGQVRHKKPRRGYPMVTPSVRRNYATVVFCVLDAAGHETGRKQFAVHRLVWESFVSEIPAGMQINHKNGIKTDNRLANLEVCTPSENAAHAFRVLGRIHPLRGSRNNFAKLKESDIPVLRKRMLKGESKERLAEEYGVTRMTMYNIHWRKIWCHVK